MTDENRILKPSTNFPPPFSSEPSSLVASRPILLSFSPLVRAFFPCRLSFEASSLVASRSLLSVLLFFWSARTLINETIYFYTL